MVLGIFGLLYNLVAILCLDVLVPIAFGYKLRILMMRKRTTMTFLVMLLFVLCSTASKANEPVKNVTYQNPLAVTFGDPFVLKASDGEILYVWNDLRYKGGLRLFLPRIWQNGRMKVSYIWEQHPNLGHLIAFGHRRYMRETVTFICSTVPTGKAIQRK